jgi:hypothetical protein
MRSHLEAAANGNRHASHPEHKQWQRDITLIGWSPGEGRARGLRLTVGSASRAGDQGGLAGTYVVLAAGIES